MRRKALTYCTDMLSRVLSCILCALLICAVVPLSPSTAQATETTVENPEYAAALERLDAISQEYDALSAQQDATLTQLEDVRSRISKNETQVVGVQQQIEDSQTHLALQQQVLAGEISADYKSGSVSLLDIILSVDSFEEAISKIYYYSAVCESQVAAIEAINTTKVELQNQQEELEQLQADLLEEQASIEELYDIQREQANSMLAQQVEAAELLTTLPSEIVVTIADDPEELVGVSELVLESQEQQAQTQNEPQTQSQNTSPQTQQQTSNSSTTITTPPVSTSSDGSLQALLDTAYATGPTRSDWGCAGWVYTVFKNSGVYSKAPSCAAWYYENWCYSSDRSQLQPGMVIAVNNTGGSAAGRRYGHVCIYIGNNTVRHFTHGAVSNMSLDKWIRYYGSVCTPRWGWAGGIALS